MNYYTKRASRSDYWIGAIGTINELQRWRTSAEITTQVARGLTVKVAPTHREQESRLGFSRSVAAATAS